MPSLRSADKIIGYVYAPLEASLICRFRLCIALLVVSTVMAMAPPRSEAQASAAGPAFLVNRFTDTGSLTFARYTDIAWDPVNRAYLVVWGLGSVWGRLVAADGTPLGNGPFKVSSSAAPTDFPRVAYSPDSGSFMVVWQDFRVSDILPGVWGRVLQYSASGVPVFPGTDFQVISPETAYVHPKVGPAIGYSTGSHEFLVVYQKGDLLARRVGNGGTPLAPEFFLTAASTNYMDGLDVGYSPQTNQFLVTWAAEWSAEFGGPKTILARLVQGGSGALSGVIEVDTWMDLIVGPPSVTYAPGTNQFLVTWYRPFAGFHTTFGRLVNANGTLPGSRFTIAPQGTYVGQGVGYNPVSDTFFCAFSYHDGPPFDVYGAQISKTGVPEQWFKLTAIDYNTDVDYTRLASATDRAEWMSSSIAHWDKVVGQRVASSSNPSVPTFRKQTPVSGVVGATSPVTLTWSILAGAAGYEVCVDSTNNSTCDSGVWQPAATTSWTTASLANGTYYWQVRQAGGSATPADYGSWWSFTVGTPVTLFLKTSPANAASGQSSPVTLTWTAAAGATGYSVCVDAVNDNGCTAPTDWVNVTTTSYAASLAAGTYYWQARATTGAVPPPMADNGTWFSFTVGGAVTPLFTKAAPANGATGQSSPAILSWNPAPGASGYTVCVDAVNDNSCTSTVGASWLTVTGTSYTTAALGVGTYYWQVRATTGATPPPMADNNAWWSFTVGGAPASPPGAFGKTAPANGATGVPSAPTLTWGASTGATAYAVCTDTTNNGLCDTTWQSAGTSTSLALTGQAAGTYYWLARATNGGGSTFSDAGTWWSYTVTATTSTPFGKLSPATQSTGLGTTVTTTWSAVANASYQVCLSTTGPSCPTDGWWPTATVPSRPWDNLPAGTYYWQARSVVGQTVTDADGGAWWTFVVGTGSSPSQFGKLAPMPGTTTTAGSPVTLSWGPVTSATYDVCVDTVNNNACDTTWQSAGSATSLARSNLAGGTYYWQARATVSGTPTEANGGGWWTFTVPAPPPPLFSKLTPASGTVGAPSSVTLTWGAVANASYQVCISTAGPACPTDGWWPTAVVPSRPYDNLPAGTYYWQARATVGSTTTEADNGTWWKFTVGSVLSGAPNGSWLFAEGANGLAAGFTTYYVIANENAAAVRVRGWIFRSDGAIASFEQTVPAKTRATIDLATLVNDGEGSYSAVIQSADANRQVFVARSMYWSGTAGVMTGPGDTKTGTLVGASASLPTQWYFAEGARVVSKAGTQFDVYYMVFNPNESAASVTMDFYADTGGGLLKSVTQSVAPRTRWTASAGSYAELNLKNFSVRVTSTLPVLAERSMYWGSNWSGGHSDVGASTLSTAWFFAEGTAMGAFDTYYLMLNPSSQPVTVTATYQLSPLANGTPQAPVTKTYTLAANSRKTVHLGTEVGLQTGVSASFSASAPIVMERSMYWGTTWTEGSNVIGSAVAAAEWHLPEGSTKDGFETYLLVSNPNSAALVADITAWNDLGQEETKSVTVPAKTRLTLYMNNKTDLTRPIFSTIPNNPFSLRVASSAATPLPIIVEEAVYWNWIGRPLYWVGGDTTLGWPIIR